MTQREPEPKLGEDQNSHHRRHVSVSRPWLQRNSHIMSPWKWSEMTSLELMHPWVSHEDAGMKQLLWKQLTQCEPSCNTVSFPLCDLTFDSERCEQCNYFYLSLYSCLVSPKHQWIEPFCVCFARRRYSSEVERPNRQTIITISKTQRINEPQGKKALHRETFLSASLNSLLFRWNMPTVLFYTSQ